MQFVNNFFAPSVIKILQMALGCFIMKINKAWLTPKRGVAAKGTVQRSGGSAVGRAGFWRGGVIVRGERKL